jgi:plastocyanin
MRRGFAAVCLALLAASAARAASVEAHVHDAAGRAIEDAAVVLEPLSGPVTRHAARATIAQRDREFIPYFTIVQTGTAVDFPNHDPFKHHVYSFSAAKKFEIKLYAGKPQQPIVFDKPGEVAIGCNIHDWMEAYVLVVDTPYFAKTDRAGHAAMANVPPGRYRLTLYHPREKGKVPPREIAIGAARAVLDLTLEAAPRVVKPKPPMDPGAY